MKNHKCSSGFKTNQADFHFLLPICCEMLLQMPLDTPKELFIFCTLTFTLPLEVSSGRTLPGYVWIRRSSFSSQGTITLDHLIQVPWTDLYVWYLQGDSRQLSFKNSIFWKITTNSKILNIYSNSKYVRILHGFQSCLKMSTRFYQAGFTSLRFAVDLLIISCGIVCACKNERSGCQMVRLFRVQELINKTPS